jgi:hypothetical protein
MAIVELVLDPFSAGAISAPAQRIFARIARDFGHSRRARRRPRSRARAADHSPRAAVARASRARREHPRPPQIWRRGLEAAHEAARVAHASGGLGPSSGKLPGRSACHGAAVSARRGTATPRRSRAAVGGRLSGRSLRREIARSISVAGSVEGGFGTLGGHQVGVGTILFGVQGLGGPVVGGRGRRWEKLIFGGFSNMSRSRAKKIAWWPPRWPPDRSHTRSSYKLKPGERLADCRFSVIEAV